MKRSLALFSIAAILPLVVVSVGMGAWTLRGERKDIEARADGHADFVATLVGRELAANIHSTQMITQSPGLDGALDADRLAMLGRRLVADEPSWRSISIADPAGNRLLDIPDPIGGVANGRIVEQDSFQRVIASKKPTVGKVMKGPKGNLAFAVRAPAIRNEQVGYVVSTVINPSSLSPLLLPSSLPDGWRVEIVDGSGSIVARSEGDESFVGQPATPAAQAARNSGSPAFYRGRGQDGDDEVATWRQIPGTDWTVHVVMPAGAYLSPLIQAGQVLAVGAVISLLLSVLLAWLLVRELQGHRQRESAVLESQRLEALGQMTGGVAHDFNNLLTPILGGLDLVRPKLDHDPRAQRLIDGAMIGAERARQLVSRLLMFARRQNLEARDVDVGALVTGLTDLLERSVGPKVTVVMDLPDDLPTAHVDPAQLELAILNLAVNARDAMEEGGTLTISAAEEKISRDATLADGRYVRVTVTDTGVGMDEATLRRAVEPFFTTKLVGKGTGLGLSMVHGLAAQSGGALKLFSARGEGTRAEIWLPVGEALAEGPAQIETLLDHRTGRLLLVDDDELVRASTAAVLRDHGHTVMEARSALEALAILSDGRPADVLITDYAMPGKNGDALIREARALRPGLPALLVTGFANYGDPLPAGVVKLAKPFRSVELLNRVSRLMPAFETAQDKVP